MAEFFKFPSTPHLVASEGVTRNDKVLSDLDRQKFLQHDLIVEEKLDGANLGISKNFAGNLVVQNRGTILSKPYTGQFSRLPSWLAIHRDSLVRALDSNIVLFGEWCAARHSIEYDALPDLFFLFDVYDLDKQAFWSVIRRDELANFSGLEIPPRLNFQIRDIQEIAKLASKTKSRFSNSFIEGIVMRWDDRFWNLGRAKLVRSEFTQSIIDHWSKKKIVWNKLKDHS